METPLKHVIGQNILCYFGNYELVYENSHLIPFIQCSVRT